jgi:hypothetical protein
MESNGSDRCSVLVLTGVFKILFNHVGSAPCVITESSFSTLEGINFLVNGPTYDKVSERFILVLSE